MTQGFNTKPLGSTSSGVKSQPSKTKSSSSVAGVSKTGVTESSPIDYVGTLSPTKSEQSDPSRSIDLINIPEIKSILCTFTYNHFTRDERITPPRTVFSGGEEKPRDKIARYVTVSWQPPARKSMGSSTTKSRIGTIYENRDVIVSEDDSLNPDYVDHTYSDDEAITRAATDLELYDKMVGRGNESLTSMAVDRLTSLGSHAGERDVAKLDRLSKTLMRVIDDPQENLGLTVTPSDPARVLESGDDDVTLHVKVHGSVVSDVFANSHLKSSDSSLASIRRSSSRVRSGTSRPERQALSVVEILTSQAEKERLTRPVEMIGYIVSRYVQTRNGFVPDDVFYVEDPSTTSIIDPGVMYGKTYLYAVRVVSAVEMLARDGDRVVPACVYVSSRSVTKVMKTEESTPPPEPTSPRFTYDFIDRRLTIHWDMPVNPQDDVKQFQVFRRKTIGEPFELICQYCFDDTIVSGDASRALTGERVDGNSSTMTDEERSYVKYSPVPVFSHTDDDFYVDPETRESSRYIYAIASVDAHGLISNYSAQVEVAYDQFSNRLTSKVVADSGSPRQYPNMTLALDAFKDAVFIDGPGSRRMDVYMAPDFLKVKDPARGDDIQVVAGSSPDRPASFYVFQMINLDNQKTQILEVEIKDTHRRTSPVKLGAPLDR